MEYGLIGASLGYSYSKMIHESFGYYPYELCPLNETEFEVFMQKREFKGINVTIPYKRAVMSYLDELDPAARAIGAVNTVVNHNGYLVGHNTDYAGFAWMLDHHNINPYGQKVLILGTGGASAAVYAVLKHKGAREILFVSRTGKDGAATYEEAATRHWDANLIVNTTPVGTFPNVDAAPVDLTDYRCRAVVDLIYNPKQTKLISQARSLHMKGITGLDMLIAQAKYAAEYFLEQPLGDELIEKAAKHLIF